MGGGLINNPVKKSVYWLPQTSNLSYISRSARLRFYKQKITKGSPGEIQTTCFQIADIGIERFKLFYCVVVTELG